MKIEIKDQEDIIILSDEELDNPNFIDIEFYDETVKDNGNELGYVAEKTVNLEELKLAVDAFYQKKLNIDKQ